MMASLLAIAAAGAMAVLIPASAASASVSTADAACVGAWNASTVYTGGLTASYNSHNWSAKWWTQGETPGTTDVWADQGTCSGGGGSTPPTGTCSYPNWAQGQNYVV